MSTHDVTPDPPEKPDKGVPHLHDPRYSQSLARGLAILGCFSPERPRLGIAQMADELGMSRSTTHRYAITLVELGYLEQDHSRKYRLGLQVIDLGRSAMGAIGIPSDARPILEQLRADAGYTASLGVLDGADVLLVERARSTRRGNYLIPAQTVGSRLPAYCTGIGKVLLAYVPGGDWRSQLGDSRLTKRGPNTITSKRQLERELADIRARGYATSEEEFSPGVYAVAAPVCDDSGEVAAAMSVTAHRSMVSLDTMVEVIGPRLMASASRMSARLGDRATGVSAAG
jgi:IclR family pca regulon transcriptional regulator